MTGFFLYASLILIGFSFVVSRYTRGLHARLQERLVEAMRELDATESAIAKANLQADDEELLAKELGDRAGGLRDKVEAAQRRLDDVRQTPVSRFYVFDRHEPRPGVHWVARVRGGSASASLRRLWRGWEGERAVLIVGRSQADVVERLEKRFARANGFEILDVQPSPLFDSAEAGRPDGTSPSVKPLS